MHKLTFAVCWVLVLCVVVGTFAERRLRPIKRMNFTNHAKVYSSEWVVHLDGGKNPSDLEELGFELVGPVGDLPNMHQIRHTQTYAMRMRDAASVSRNPSWSVTQLLTSRPGVKWASQQLLVQHSKRATEQFQDPLYPDQWHLDNTGQFDGTPGEDINILGAWADGYTGVGVQIAIVDDGYQYTHPDLSDNYVAADSVNLNGGPGSSTDPAPNVNQDPHGTSAAGVAMAAANAVCGVGAAYQAFGTGIRMIDSSVTDATEVIGMTYHNQNNHIYSNSWGPEDDGVTMGGPGVLLQAAMAQAVVTGRGGKGSVFVWAAGNGLESNDNCNYDGYANSRFAIAVGAIGNDGKQAYYSEPCASLVVVAPSNSLNTDAGIRTTDLLGQAGYESDDCDSQFGGTSSSCPLVSGVIALILQANNSLTWRDVLVVLAVSARQNDPSDSDWTSNGRGFHVNHKYGFGAVDATAAVNVAKKHVLLSPEISATAAYSTVTIVPPNSAVGFTASLKISQNFNVEKVVIYAFIDHPTSGDLQVTLISPSGTNSVLAEPHSNYPTIKISGSPAVHEIGVAEFGAPMPFQSQQGTVVAASPIDGCGDITNCDSLDGSIAYVSVDGNCAFTSRAAAVQACGAIAILVYNTDSSDGSTIKIIPGSDSDVTIPVGFIDYTYASTQNLPGKQVQLGQYRYPANNYENGWNFSTVRSLGENSQGTWNLTIADPRFQPQGVSGNISFLQITVYGSNSPLSFSSSSPSGFSYCLYSMATFLVLLLTLL